MVDAKLKKGWPRGGDVKQWLRCQISKAGAIDDLRERVQYTSFAIEDLAELGLLQEATRQLERMIRALPRDEGFERVGLLELGAKIHLEAGKLDKMEEYLQRVLATRPLHTRKCDKGWELGVVHKFKREHDLLDSSEAKDQWESAEASFNRSRRLIRQSIAQGDKAAARDELAKAEKIIPRLRENWRRRHAYGFVLDWYLEIKDRRSAQRLVKGMSKAERENALDGEELWAIGFQKEAMASIEKELREALGELASGEPNVHMHGSTIKDWLLFFIKIGKEDLARRWLARVLAEGKSWQFVERGWASAALFQSLAEVVTQLDGVDAADKLLSLAIADSKNEKRRGWRGQEEGTSIQLLAKAGQLERALAMARKMRSPARRRAQLVSLLAENRRWKELREVLGEAKTPLEAAELCWSVRIALEGGEKPE